MGTDSPGLIENAVQAVFDQVEEYRKQIMPAEVGTTRSGEPSSKHSGRSSKKIDKAQMLVEQQKHMEQLKAMVLGLKVGSDDRAKREEEIKA